MSINDGNSGGNAPPQQQTGSEVIWNRPTIDPSLSGFDFVDAAVEKGTKAHDAFMNAVHERHNSVPGGYYSEPALKETLASFGGSPAADLISEAHAHRESVLKQAQRAVEERMSGVHTHGDAASELRRTRSSDATDRRYTKAGDAEKSNVARQLILEARDNPEKLSSVLEALDANGAEPTVVRAALAEARPDIKEAVDHLAAVERADAVARATLGHLSSDIANGFKSNPRRPALKSASYIK